MGENNILVKNKSGVTGQNMTDQKKAAMLDL